jgi:tRNA nucleotidyltransferase (CCA-adding enzyme)
MTRTYLVGGAVRDRLLGIEPRERDWVVVGSTPEAMRRDGYRQVGASFPVFLHPDTSEEYALARTEKKQGHGYHGFAVDFHPGVTLEQDLERRDLTINAMAEDENGRLIDPFGGQADLEARLLRHVSPAFSEDPLRVLRVARFAARFSNRGFRVHPETLELMSSITDSGELEHLVAERCWAEIRSALAAPTPSAFLAVLRDCGALEVLLPEVDVLFGVPQPVKYHPEIDTGLHVQLSMDVAAAEGWPAQVVFAVLLHDLGKGITPRDQWPSHYGHEAAGLPLVRAVCERLKVPTAWRELAERVCELHLRCHRLLVMKPAKVLSLIEQADLLRRPERLQPFVQACEADYRGRTGWAQRAYPQATRLESALEAALGVTAGGLDLAGLDGPEIGRRLRQARVEAIAGSENPAG